MIHSLWLFPLGLATPRFGQAALRSGSRGVSVNDPSHSRICLCPSLSGPAVSFRLMADPTTSERASGRIRGDGTSRSSMASAFQTSGKMLGAFPCSQVTSVRLSGTFFPVLDRAGPLVG